jgi:predicted MPP superfamily phosphohydrolase
LLIFFTSLVLFGLAGLLFTYFETKRRQINTLTAHLRSKTLSKPLRILHLSDIHFTRPDKSIDRFFDRLAAADYDLAVISGDIFDSDGGISSAVLNLKKIKARLGIHAVFGNHDYYDYRVGDVGQLTSRGHRLPSTRQPVDRFIQALNEAGVRLLRNERIEWKEGDQVISLFGMDDPVTGHADMEKLMHKYNPQHINILLTHTIDAFFYVGKGEIDLSFTGHSHGGQIRFPWIGPIVTHTQFGPRYVEGIQEVKGAICVISRGIGTSRFFPFRLMAPPEAVILELRGKQ